MGDKIDTMTILFKEWMTYFPFAVLIAVYVLYSYGKTVRAAVQEVHVR